MARSATYRVIYGDTDRMGFLYNGNYLRLFEIGRNEYFRNTSFTYRSLEEYGYMLPVLEAHCVYKQNARYDDLLTISTSVTQLTRVRMRFDYQITREDVLIAHGYTLHAFMNTSNKICRLPEKFYEILAANSTVESC